jgi:hypothetical protein
MLSSAWTSAVQADDSIESLTGWPSCRCADMSIDDLRNMAEGYCWDSGVNAEIRANLFDMVDLSVDQVQHLLDNATEWKDAITVANGTHCMYAIFSNMNCLEYIKFITNSPCTL